MLTAILRYVDGLFWETKIITTTRIRRRYYPTSESQNLPTSLMTNPHAPEHMRKVYTGITTITAGDETFHIPELVLDRPPLHTPDGSLDYMNFPAYRGAPLVVCCMGHNRKFASVDGVPLGRKGGSKEWSRRHAFVNADLCDDWVLNNPSAKVYETTYQDIDIRVVKHKDWLYLTFCQPHGHLVRFYQTNAGQWDHSSDRIIMAFAYARSLIMTFGAVSQPYTTISEHDLAGTILSLLVKTDD